MTRLAKHASTHEHGIPPGSGPRHVCTTSPEAGKPVSMAGTVARYVAVDPDLDPAITGR